eukprot:CAMPEP_0181261002 /NCGR_PEP_ID=MMETSP1097-20121128/1253_1 /TAXON_ID=35684 /ORGANISM="Pseudopedinella elastica, Strain CCMP716" /LENGTH=34 /DNA_ID= /DNA_START= /DNA_END= /DNA_ORIENTATION=
MRIQAGHQYPGPGNTEELFQISIENSRYLSQALR